MNSQALEVKNSSRKTISPIVGKRIILRELTPSDVTERYVAWMNDPAINQYLESRFQSHTTEELVRYVERIAGDPDSYLFAIIEKRTMSHIGNIKIGPINRNHARASVGIVIGSKRFSGTGAGTEAVHLVTKFAVKKLNLHKLTAGFYAPNQGSEKVFIRNGYDIEGIRGNHSYCNGAYVDVIEMGLVNPDYRTI